MDTTVIEQRKARARAWFEALRDDICRAFERLEDDAPGSLYPGDAGRFVRTPWDRTDHTGDPAAAGHVSDARTAVRKVGVLVDRARRIRPGIPRPDSAPRRPRFWASGISLIAHMRNPNVPAVHMNTRFVVTTPGFGGGADSRRYSTGAGPTMPTRLLFMPRCGCLRRRTALRLRKYKNGVTNILSAASQGARARRHLLRLA